MTASAEQFVQVLDRATGMFELAGDLQVFKEGLTDLVRRIEALERQVALLTKSGA